MDHQRPTQPHHPLSTPFAYIQRREMHLEQHEKSDGKQVWLTTDELDQLINTVESNERNIALRLAGRCGLRTKELLDVSPNDIVDGPAGTMVRVWEGKGDKYREAPVPHGLSERISAVAETMNDPTIPVVDVSERTVQNWVSQAATKCYEETGDQGWKYVTPHDLRRSWAQGLLDSGVEAGMVMEWGGWDSWEVFRDHYLGKYSPKIQQEERGKVNWL